MRFRPDRYICPVCKRDFASRREKCCPGCGTLLLIASDVLSDEELTALTSFWMWETPKGRWNYIANWEAAKREAVERIGEFTKARLGGVFFDSGSDKKTVH
ncbi:MAG TPA: hypothetical protein VNH65_07555 [Candidatus Acidoferrum sp.]|nr:hypothetical protein [Candidatus Acidoferrum sp.]